MRIACMQAVKERDFCMIALAQSEIYHLFQGHDEIKALAYSLIVSLLVLENTVLIALLPSVFAGSFTASPCPFQCPLYVCCSAAHRCALDWTKLCSSSEFPFYMKPTDNRYFRKKNYSHCIGGRTIITVDLTLASHRLVDTFEIIVKSS